MATKKKFQVVYHDGCNGWRLGDVVEAEVSDGRLLFSDEDGEYEGVSRNGDGLYEDAADGSVLYVPVPAA